MVLMPPPEHKTVQQIAVELSALLIDKGIRIAPKHVEAAAQVTLYLTQLQAENEYFREKIITMTREQSQLVDEIRSLQEAARGASA